MTTAVVHRQTPREKGVNRKGVNSSDSSLMRGTTVHSLLDWVAEDAEIQGALFREPKTCRKVCLPG